MRKGIGLAVALGGISLLGSFYIFFKTEKDSKTIINPQRAEQYKAANEIMAMSLNEAINGFYNAHQRYPDKAEELVPQFLEMVPVELFSRLSVTVKTYDGTGGWVFDGGTFRPNHPQVPNTQ